MPLGSAASNCSHRCILASHREDNFARSLGTEGQVCSGYGQPSSSRRMGVRVPREGEMGFAGPYFWAT